MGKTLIVVPVWDQLRFTIVSVNQILDMTEGDYALLVVDNGSTDKTPEFLAEMRAKHPDRLFTITNPENRGYPTALNQGIAWGEERGCKYYLCLNNDIIITERGWLECFIGPLREDPRQLVGARLIDFNDLVRFEGHTIPYLEGWALALHRQFLKDVGRFDEAFSPGWFEDVDLSYRAVRAGYRLTQSPCFAWRDMFVQVKGPVRHLYGQTGFRKLDFAPIAKRNRAYFARKWGFEDAPS